MEQNIQKEIPGKVSVAANLCGAKKKFSTFVKSTENCF